MSPMVSLNDTSITDSVTVQPMVSLNDTSITDSVTVQPMVSLNDTSITDSATVQSTMSPITNVPKFKYNIPDDIIAMIDTIITKTV
jgi:bifunctional N-acetylglucosamine-1-phosphate-uridyltransferase/glucosamine-1-phosphate-acetyltransferase GlmU-like protein